MKTLFILVSLIFFTDSAKAHPYFPLRQGSAASYDYSFSVDSTRPELKATNTHGKMFATNRGEVDKEGKRYFRFETAYEGISYMKGTAELWRREEGGNIYLANLIGGKFNETLEIPSDVSVGKEWDYNDGQQSKRKITAKLAVRLPDGSTLPDCIEVTRTILDKPNLRDVVNITYYCRDTGDAGSIFKQPSPIGEYCTKVELLSYVAG